MNVFLRSPIKKKQYVLLVVDVLIIFFVFVFAYAFRIVVYEGENINVLSARFSWLVLLAVLLHLVSFYIFELYSIDIKRSGVNLFSLITIAVLFAVGLIVIAGYIFPQARLGRVIVSIHTPVLITILFLWRRFFYAVVLRKSPRNNLLLIGSDCSLKEIRNLLDRYRMVDYNLSAVICDYKDNPGLIDINGVEHGPSLESFVKKSRIRTIVMADEFKKSSRLKRELIDLKFAGIEIYDMPTFYKKLTAKIPVLHIGDDWVLFSNQDKSFNPAVYLKLKRIMDVVFAGAGLVLSVPLFLIIALAVRLTSRGPVIFRQQRLGLNERPFTLLKFRTMVDDAEKETGPRWSSADDPRVTRVGRFLRKTRLDEIPQLVNILRGEMSFVGPRPIRKHFAEQLDDRLPYYRLRFTVKPGITGWAQVRGDYAGSVEGQLKKLEYDLFYIQNRSMFLDLFIILKTAQTVLFRRGE